MSLYSYKNATAFSAFFIFLLSCDQQMGKSLLVGEHLLLRWSEYGWMKQVAGRLSSVKWPRVRLFFLPKSLFLGVHTQFGAHFTTVLRKVVQQRRIIKRTWQCTLPEWGEVLWVLIVLAKGHSTMFRWVPDPPRTTQSTVKCAVTIASCCFPHFFVRCQIDDILILLKSFTVTVLS